MPKVPLIGACDRAFISFYLEIGWFILAVGWEGIAAFAPLSLAGSSSAVSSIPQNHLCPRSRTLDSDDPARLHADWRWGPRDGDGRRSCNRTFHEKNNRLWHLEIGRREATYAIH